MTATVTRRWRAEAQVIGVPAADEPVPAWRVLRRGSVESRSEALHAAATLPLLGRELVNLFRSRR